MGLATGPDEALRAVSLRDVIKSTSVGTDKCLDSIPIDFFLSKTLFLFFFGLGGQSKPPRTIKAINRFLEHTEELWIGLD